MQGLYVVKDVPAQQFGPPMMARTEMVASRIFVQMLAQGKLAQADYELYSIGTYDEDTGEAKTHAPVFVVPTYKRDASLEEVL
nr:MAG: nonstructural protein [Microvirus sp.]